MNENTIRIAREEAENWRSRYELISLEVSFWRKRHDMLLQAMADSAALTVSPPMLLANQESYELGRLHGAADEREACAKECEKVDANPHVVLHHAVVCAAAIRARGKT